MRIVIPVSPHDVHMMELSLAVMRHLGGIENHVVSLSPTQSQIPIAESAAEELRLLCPTVDVLNIPFESDGRWPQSPNMHWAHTAEALRHGGNREPWFWCELDFTPDKKDWADRIDQGWRGGRQPFHGTIVQKPSRNAAGAIVFESDDLMMMGCAVYPWNIHMLPHYENVMKGLLTGTQPEPFDVYLRGWMRSHGWSGSNLVGDRWNTQNYRMKDGKLLCDPAPTQFLGRDHSKTDLTGSVGVHGCKDGSYARLVLADFHEEIMPTTAQTQAIPAPSAPFKDVPFTPAGPFSIPRHETPAPEPAQERPTTLPEAARRHEMLVIETLVGAHGEIMLALEAAQQRFDAAAARIESIAQSLENSIAEAQKLNPDQTRQTEPPPPDRIAEIPEIETIRGMVNGKRPKLSDLALDLNVDEKTLKKFIRRKDSRMQLESGGRVRLLVT
jgi:hypothetical protein